MTRQGKARENMSAWSAPGKSWEKGGGRAPFISSASSRCSFVFALQFCDPNYLGAWNRLITAEFERVPSFPSQAAWGECKFGCLVAPPTFIPREIFYSYKLPVENLDSSLSHVSVNNDVTMERGDSGWSTLLFNKCILQYRYSINLYCNIEATDFQPDRKTTGTDEH